MVYLRFDFESSRRLLPEAQEGVKPSEVRRGVDWAFVSLAIAGIADVTLPSDGFR